MNQNNSTAATAAGCFKTVLSWIVMISGWFIAAFSVFGVFLFSCSSDPEILGENGEVDVSGIITFLVLLCIGLAMIILPLISRSRKKRASAKQITTQGKYRAYLSAVQQKAASGEDRISIDSLAAAFGVTSGEAAGVLQEMVSKGFLPGVLVNQAQHMLVLPSTAVTKANIRNVVCKYCMASVSVPAGGSAICEYCGRSVDDNGPGGPANSNGPIVLHKLP